MTLPKWLQLKDVDSVHVHDTTPPTYQEPHIHEWQQQLTSYAPPRRDASQFAITDAQSYAQALMGVTTLLYECAICHETKKEQLPGSQNPQLDDMLDKAELYGPQYLQRNGITFLIQRYSIPNQTGSLPLR